MNADGSEQRSRPAHGRGLWPGVAIGYQAGWTLVRGAFAVSWVRPLPSAFMT
jgi:hypothetical protein